MAFTQEMLEGPEELLPSETPSIDEEYFNVSAPESVEENIGFSSDMTAMDKAILLQNICVRSFYDNGIVCAGVKVETSACGVILIISTLTCIGPVPLSVFEDAFGALAGTRHFDKVFDAASSKLDYDMVSGVSTLQISFSN